MPSTRGEWSVADTYDHGRARATHTYQHVASKEHYLETSSGDHHHYKSTLTPLRFSQIRHCRQKVQKGNKGREKEKESEKKHTDLEIFPRLGFRSLDLAGCSFGRLVRVRVLAVCVEGCRCL